jgi:hypothetical protein
VKAPFPTPKDVDRVVAFKPLRYSGETAAARAKRESDCRAMVTFVLRQLRRYDMTTNSQVRRHVERYAGKLRSARAMLREMAPSMWGLSAIESHAGTLDALRLEADRLLADDRVWRYPKPEVARTRHAAAHAFHLLMDFWKITPTTTRDGAWHELTELLCEVAVGAAARRDTWRACQWTLAHDSRVKVAVNEGVDSSGMTLVRFVDPRKMARKTARSPVE